MCHQLHTLTGACACAPTHTHTHKRITELMTDLPHVDSVMGCGLEHSNRTSGQTGPHKDPLVVSFELLAHWLVMCSSVTTSLPWLPLSFFDFVHSTWIYSHICSTLGGHVYATSSLPWNVSINLSSCLFWIKSELRICWKHKHSIFKMGK